MRRSEAETAKSSQARGEVEGSEGIMKKRLFYLIIDQLAGHWAENVRVKDDFPPANLAGYHRLGLIPNFSGLIKKGLWVKRPWNRGICTTPHGMKYLAGGFYNKGAYWGSFEDTGAFYPETPDEEGFFEFCKKHYPGRFKASVFTTDYWVAKGYFYVPQDMHALPACYPDEQMWYNCALPYIRRNPDWNLLHLYFPLNDTISYCPSYQALPFYPTLKHISKHAYLLFLDILLGEVIGFLKEKGYWKETYFVLASDHGYHLGCSVAHDLGVKEKNWCCDHPAPHDCQVWDFERNKATGFSSDCARRTAFILSGGALEDKYAGKTVEEAEIIDVIPTIAELLDVPYRCEGRSILSRVV